MYTRFTSLINLIFREGITRCTSYRYLLFFETTIVLYMSMHWRLIFIILMRRNKDIDYDSLIINLFHTLLIMTDLGRTSSLLD